VGSFLKVDIRRIGFVILNAIKLITIFPLGSYGYCKEKIRNDVSQVAIGYGD